MHGHDLQSLHDLLLHILHETIVGSRLHQTEVQEVKGAQFLLARVLCSTLDNHFYVIDYHL